MAVSRQKYIFGKTNLVEKIVFPKMKSRGNPMVECPGEILYQCFETLDYLTTYEVKSDLSTIMVPASIAAFCAAVT